MTDEIFRAVAEFVSYERPGCLLVLPCPSGVADLGRVALLDENAKSLWDGLQAGLSLDQAADILRTRGAESRAASDARHFLEDAQARGLLEGTHLEGSALRFPEGTSAPADATVVSPPPGGLGVDDLEELIRVALKRGVRVRFRAHGSSMRPQIPDGSVLEVERREFDRVRLGEIILYRMGPRHLVAHRVVAHDGRMIVTKGDTSIRRDEVRPPAFLGVVAFRVTKHRRLPVSFGWRRAWGLCQVPCYRAGVGTARTLASVLSDSPLRQLLLGLFRGVSGILRKSEQAAFRARRGSDVLRSVLLETEDKDRLGRLVYTREGPREFTALDENVEAGLTLIEEVALTRHVTCTGRALVLGCGPGREAVALSRRGFDTVVGIDRSEGMLVHARRLAAKHGRSIQFLQGDASAFDLPGPPFDLIVAFSGLINLVLPRARRVDLLEAAARHLAPGGRLMVTFLSAYVRAEEPLTQRAPGWARLLNKDHEPGDRYLINEPVHIYPHPSLFNAEASDAGLDVLVLWRDQRAYDRHHGQVRGYALLAQHA